ncbi:putative tail component, partial [Escherichia coli EC1870]
RRLVPDTYSR